jgi:hypothetical protein
MNQTAERKTVIDAINSLGRRVTSADVASKTGLPLHVANVELNRVAADTNGHLEVSTTGDIVYKFAPGFEAKYMATGIKRVLNNVMSKTFEILYFLLRISFGVMLVVSFIAIVVLIIIAMIVLSRLGSSGDGGGDDGGGFGFDFDFFDFMILRDLFYWGAWSNPNIYVDYNRPSSRPAEKSNFLFNVFSFLFGDGNPNNHLDERQWQMIAEVIRNNRGVVTAEQLAPYTGADPKNEDAVLPVLVRFEGKPEVTESGNIVYVFPSMQVRAAISQFGRDFVPLFLNEYPWKFTNASQGSLTPVYALATANFLGSWWLLTYSKLFVLHAFLPVIIALTIYGTLFVTIPLVRYLVLQWLNSRIEARNKKRADYAAVVQNKPAELAQKLHEAANYRITERTISEKDLAYSTEKDNLEQQFTEDIAEFDKQLGKTEATAHPVEQKHVEQQDGQAQSSPHQNQGRSALPNFSVNQMPRRSLGSPINRGGSQSSSPSTGHSGEREQDNVIKDNVIYDKQKDKMERE